MLHRIMLYTYMEHVLCCVWAASIHRPRALGSLRFFLTWRECVYVCPDWFSVIHCKSVWRTWVRSFLWNVNAELTTAPFFQRMSFDEYVFVFACEKGIINTFGYVDSTTFMNNHDAAGLCLIDLFALVATNMLTFRFAHILFVPS